MSPFNCTPRVCNESESSRHGRVVLCVAPNLKIVMPWSPVMSCRMLSCRVMSHMCELSYRRHDTTAGDTTRFSLPIQLNGSVHTYAARPRLVVTTKSCCHKNRSGSDLITLEAIFVVCHSDNIKKTAKENGFHRNLTWVYKFMTQQQPFMSQYLQFNVTAVQFYDVNYRLTSFSIQSPVKCDQNFWIRFLE